MSPIAAALLALQACSTPEAPTPLPVQAPPHAAPAAAPPTAATGPGQPRAVDTQRSQVVAVGSKITGKHEITFPALAGTVTFDGATPTSLDLTLDVASLRTDSDRLAEHLRSPDFFDVAAHPTAAFRSTRIQQAGAGATVTGDLTIRGTTRSVTFPVTVSETTEDLVATASFPIDRREFGVVYPGKPDDLIKDEVPLTITVTVPGK